MWIHQKDALISDKFVLPQKPLKILESVPTKVAFKSTQPLTEQQRAPLSGSLRDHKIRKILSQLSLTDSHRQTLRQRGLTDEQIEQGNYKSVEKWQKLICPVDDRLAGVKRGGRKLLTPDRGIICPIPNYQGQLVGWQLRLDNPEDGCKYIWAAGEKKRSDRPTSHLANGELPIAVYQPYFQSQTTEIGLTEGVSFKPYLASLKLNMPVLGASGGNFASSPQTLKQYLKQLGALSVILYPDAGAVINFNVIRTYQKTFALLEKWGYQVKVAWWNQIDKSSPDIDEISPQHLEKISYLNTQEFLSLAWYEQTKVKIKNNYKKLKQFSPNCPINSQFFAWKAPTTGEILAVKSGLGTGKSTWISRLLSKDFADSGCIGLGHRNSLLLQSCARWQGFHHFHYHNGKNLLDVPNSRLLLCVDSLIHFQEHQFDDKILIIDEAVSVIRHLLTGQTAVKKKRKQILKLFEQAVRRCKLVILLDGMMADWVVEYVQKLAGASKGKVTKVENLFPTQPKQIEFLQGEVDLSDPFKIHERSYYIQKLLQSQRPFIATDSQIYAESLEQLLQRSGKLSGLRIDSVTLADRGEVGEKVRAFLQNPDRWLECNQPDYLIISPTAQDGIDISIKNYFDRAFGFFFHLHTDAQMQMLGRLRDRIPKYFVWCAQFINTGQKRQLLSLSELQQERIEFLRRDLEDALKVGNSQQIIEIAREICFSPQDSHWEAKNVIELVERHEKRNLRESLKQALIEAGHQIVEVSMPVTDELELAACGEKEALSRVKESRAIEIFTAPDINELQAARLERQFNQTWSQRCALIKYSLKQRLPGIENTPAWQAEFMRKVYYDDRHYLERVELYWLLKHPDAARRIQQQEWSRYLNRESHPLLRDYNDWLGDKSNSAVRVRGLIEVGLDSLISSGAEYTSESRELIELYWLCQKYKIGVLIGIYPSRNCTPLGWLRNLLAIVGLKLRASQRQVDGQKKRFYRIQEPSDPYWQHCLEAIERKWNEQPEFFPDLNRAD
ncbi:MAG: plasmid replication protein, CyRepA1 family [Prochloraceae cyanobacterium]